VSSLTAYPTAVVLGSGSVGSAIAKDLFSDFRVRVADINSGIVDLYRNWPPISPHVLDLRDTTAVQGITQGADVVVCSVPGRLGAKVLADVIAGRGTSRVVDIAFSENDPRLLHDFSVENGVTVIPKMGIAPGMSHALVGLGHSLLNGQAEEAQVYVGSLPEDYGRRREYDMLSVLEDALAKLIKPARFKLGGRLMVNRNPLQGVVSVDFLDIGFMECFLSDGLGTLLDIDIPSVMERTMLYPGHLELIRMLRQARFSNAAQLIRPQQKQLLRYGCDFMTMRVIVKGSLGGRSIEYVWDLYTEDNSKHHPVAKTAGCAATMAARALMQGLIPGPGVIMPETVGQLYPGAVAFMLQGLEYRNIYYEQSINVST